MLLPVSLRPAVVSLVQVLYYRYQHSPIVFLLGNGPVMIASAFVYTHGDANVSALRQSSSFRP